MGIAINRTQYLLTSRLRVLSHMLQKHILRVYQTFPANYILEREHMTSKIIGSHCKNERAIDFARKHLFLSLKFVIRVMMIQESKIRLLIFTCLYYSQIKMLSEIFHTNNRMILKISGFILTPTILMVKSAGTRGSGVYVCAASDLNILLRELILS